MSLLKDNLPLLKDNCMYNTLQGGSMTERRKSERRKADRRMAKRVGKIYKVAHVYTDDANSSVSECEILIRIIRVEGEYVLISTLAESVAGLTETLGYKVSKTFRPLLEAPEVPPKELPLYLSWPYKTTAYYTALKGDG
jgi:hypothetical protein